MFIAHGAPSLALDDNAYTQFLQKLGRTLPTPKAIVLFSAHWESAVQYVSDVRQYPMIYDFGGFPDALYHMVYPATGNAQVTEEVTNLLQSAGIAVQRDASRGLDHGAWVVLRLLFPSAEIPVVAMSVNPAATPQENYRVGQALAKLRSQNVLIVGSGGTVHNLRMLSSGGPAVEWAVEFDEWLAGRIETWDTDALFHYADIAPQANLAVPPHAHEHFIPLLYAAGAADDSREGKRLFQSYEYGSLSYAVWQFGSSSVDE